MNNSGTTAQDRNNFHQFNDSRIAALRGEKGKKHQGGDVAKVIDTVEQAVSTAKKVYRVIKPVVNTFTNRSKTK